MGFLKEIAGASRCAGGDGMRPFRENAFYLLAWRAFLVALITLVLMITRSFELAAAFLIGANVALLFSLSLMVWSEWLNEERIVWTEAAHPNVHDAASATGPTVGSRGIPTALPIRATTTSVEMATIGNHRPGGNGSVIIARRRIG